MRTASSQGQLAWVAYYDPYGEGGIVNSSGGAHINLVAGEIVSGTIQVDLDQRDE